MRPSLFSMTPLVLTPAMEQGSPKELANSQRPDLGPGYSLYLRESRQSGGGGVALVAVPPLGNYLFAVNNGASAPCLIP